MTFADAIIKAITSKDNAQLLTVLDALEQVKTINKLDANKATKPVGTTN